METNQMGTEFAFSLIFILIILFSMPFVAIASTDYYEIGNAKDSVDKAVKRSITTCMVNLVEDDISINHEIGIEQEQLKRDIKIMAEKEVKKIYGFDFAIDAIEIVVDDKYAVAYKGHIIYHPLIFKGQEAFTIPVQGRGKIQRFDKE